MSIGEFVGYGWPSLSSFFSFLSSLSLLRHDMIVAVFSRRWSPLCTGDLDAPVISEDLSLLELW